MRISSVLATVGLMMASLLSFAGTGKAAVCTYDHSCMFSNASLTGYWYDDGGLSRPHWDAVAYRSTSIRLWAGDGVYNNVSSMDNWDPNSTVAVYYNSNYAGACFTIRAYGTVHDFSFVTLNNGTRANDRMNSHRYNYNCGPLYG